MAQQGFEEDLLRRWFPHNVEETLTPFTESDIREIADVLTRCARERWSRVPRLYSILRKIGQLDTIDAFVDSDITDVYFPFTKSTLPEALRDHSARLRFLELQHLVYNQEALKLERHAPHGHFSDSTEVPFKKVGELGKGGFGYVDRVVSTISHKEYARKLILRGKTFKKDKQVLKDFTKELGNLKKLSHKHLVELVGSYTDKRFVAIVMLPVADANLQTFLEKTDFDENSRSFLRPFFGCLTSALCYLHDNRIRHKDIKPSNVLIKGDQVYFTDFGTALDWSSSGSSITATAAPTTPRYCAPEVMAYTERNSSSDIWSFGCVFLEMWTVLRSRTLEELKTYMTTHGSCATSYHSNPEAITGWIEVLRSSAGPSSDLIPSTWIEKMLREKPTERWNVHVLEDHIEEACMDPNVQHMFQGICCLQSTEDTSEIEWTSAEDEEDTLLVHSQTHDAPDSSKVEEAHEGPDMVQDISDHTTEDDEAQVSLRATDEGGIDPEILMQMFGGMGGGMGGGRSGGGGFYSSPGGAYFPAPYCETESESSAEGTDARLARPSWNDSLTYSPGQNGTYPVGEEPVQRSEKPQTHLEYTVRCPYRCGTILTGVHAVKNLADHIEVQACAGSRSNQLNSRFLCPIEDCGRKYSQSGSFRLHMERRHSAPPSIQRLPAYPIDTASIIPIDTTAVPTRQLDFVESDAATNFEMHARECSRCKSPVDVYARHSKLCPMGFLYARKLLELMYTSDGDVFATTNEYYKRGITKKDVYKLDVPSLHFAQVESLFEAVKNSAQTLSTWVLEEDGHTRFFRTNPNANSWIELHQCSRCKRPLGSQVKLLRNGEPSHRDCRNIVYQNTKHKKEIPRLPPSPPPKQGGLYSHLYPTPPPGYNMPYDHLHTTSSAGDVQEEKPRLPPSPSPRQGGMYRPQYPTPPSPSPSLFAMYAPQYPTPPPGYNMPNDHFYSTPPARDEQPYFLPRHIRSDQDSARRSSRPKTAKRATTGSARKGSSKPEPERRADSGDEEEGDDRRSDDLSERISRRYGPEDVRWAPRSGHDGETDPDGWYRVGSNGTMVKRQADGSVTRRFQY